MLSFPQAHANPLREIKTLSQQAQHTPAPEPAHAKQARAGVPASLAFAAAIAIFVLTALPPEVTGAQSDSVGDLLAGLLGAFPGVYDPQAGELFGIGIRRWAHVVEFGVLGLFVAMAACRMLRPRLARAAGASLAICLACSLLDQCHKLFVPGRHFDGADLVVDAVGYGLAILVVVAWGRAHRVA